MAVWNSLNGRRGPRVTRHGGIVREPRLGVCPILHIEQHLARAAQRNATADFPLSGRLMKGAPTDRRRGILPFARTYASSSELRNTFPENESPALLAPRSRFRLCARRDYDGRDERADGSDRPALAVAERLRGARHRLDPTRVPRSHDRDERDRPSPSAHGYVAYYMRSRTHLALGKDTPITRPVSPLSAGRIVAMPEVGGLHHRYDRVAA